MEPARSAVAQATHTPASAIKEILPFLDMVLVMTVNPGYSGQKFIPETLDKVKKIRGWIEDSSLDVDIQVDGGVTAETLPLAQQAGANVYVAASAIFKHPEGIGTGLRALQAQIH